jgi:antitoxin ParD1/3/4
MSKGPPEDIWLIRERRTRLATLDAAIARGLADADAGRTRPAADVFNRLEAKYRTMTR